MGYGKATWVTDVAPSQIYIDPPYLSVIF